MGAQHVTATTRCGGTRMSMRWGGPSGPSPLSRPYVNRDHVMSGHIAELGRDRDVGPLLNGATSFMFEGGPTYPCPNR